MLSSVVVRITATRYALVGVLLALGLSHAVANPVDAQSSGAKAAAETLFDRGLDLMREGRFDEACKQLESSQSLDPAIGTMLYLAECYERQGRIASAWALFREASSAARAAGQHKRAKLGASRAKQLAPQLSSLVVEVAEAHRLVGLKIERNDIILPEGSWGVALPIDPGTHELRVTAPGYQPWEHTLTIGTETAQTTVSVPALQPVPRKAPLPAVAEADATEADPNSASEALEINSELNAASPMADTTAPAETVAPDLDENPGRGQRVVGYVLGGAGLLALGVAGVFSLQAKNKNSDAEDLCSPNAAGACTNPDAIERSDDAKKAAGMATALTIGGAGLLAGGLLVYLLAPSQAEHLQLQVDQTSAGLWFRGAL